METTKKSPGIYSIVVTILFLLIVSFPLINLELKVISENRNENFNYSTKPEFEIANLDPFPHQFEKYYNENYGLRSIMISLNTYFKIKVLGVSPDQSKVLMGKNNWLYFANGYLDDYKGTNFFSKEELTKIKKGLHKRAVWLNNRGTTFYLAVVPNKHTIYPEYLPDYIFKRYERSALDQFMDVLKSDTLIHLIDLRPCLLSAKKEHILYYRKDNHWNDFGAFCGYTEIISDLRKKYPLIQSVSQTDYTVDTSVNLSGGEALMIDVDDMIKENRVMFKPKFKSKATDGIKQNYPIPESFPYKGDYEIVKVVNNNSLPTAVIIRDSYTDFMLQFLQEDFKKSTYIFDNWEYKSNKNIIENENPNIVVLEIIEHNLRHLLNSDETE